MPLPSEQMRQIRNYNSRKISKTELFIAVIWAIMLFLLYMLF